MLLEDGSNNPVILRSDTAYLFLAVPVRNELKIRLDPYYKKAKCSLMLLMYLGIPSLFLFYLAINKVQRGFFFCKAGIAYKRWATTEKVASVYLNTPVSIYLSAIALQRNIYVIRSC